MYGDGSEGPVTLTRSLDKKCSVTNCGDMAVVGLNGKWVCMVHLEERLKIVRIQMEETRKALNAKRIATAGKTTVHVKSKRRAL